MLLNETQCVDWRESVVPNSINRLDQFFIAFKSQVLKYVICEENQSSDNSLPNSLASSQKFICGDLVLLNLSA